MFQRCSLYTGLYILGIIYYENFKTFNRSCFQNGRPVNWIKLRNLLGNILNTYSKVWHGYEILGLENIPESGAVLVVFYHAAFPLDQLYFISRVYFEKQRAIWSVVDKFFKDAPNSKAFLEFLNLIPGDFDLCKGKLRDGEILLIAPGGVYEALFSDDCYKTLWQERLGFAKLAMDTDVKVVPVFTKNAREAWVTMKIFGSLWRKLYNKTRLPITPVYGGLPVKLTTIVGKPISISDCKNPRDVKDRIQVRMEELIARNQKIPGCMWKALLERVS